MSEVPEWIQMDDASDFRNLLRARVMVALGSKDDVYQAIIDLFEKRVEMTAREMVGGS